MTLISPRHRLSLAISLLSALALAPAVEAEPLRDRANDLFNPVPASGNSAADGKLNPDQVELGKMLFFEPRISASHLISCNTCHNVGFGGHDYLPTSIGHGWQRGPRNSPTVFNAVFNAAQFWDGRAAD
ncbi:MAG TPA: cytochrome C peroxidase, partial [Halieaceae bacterium]|nr:cytochrome C peroxidase [Halieaceae bacterium]